MTYRLIIVYHLYNIFTQTPQSVKNSINNLVLTIANELVSTLNKCKSQTKILQALKQNIENKIPYPKIM